MKPIQSWLLATAACAAAGCSTLAAPTDAGEAAPGTATRPVLSAAEAARFTPAHYFAQAGLYAAPTAAPWAPGRIALDAVSPDFVVAAVPGTPGATHATIQQAVNAAIAQGGTQRRYIEILPGTYPGAVYIPAGAPPLTLYGAGKTADDVRIELSLDALSLPGSYARTVNPAGQFAPTDPAWPMYEVCASLPADKKIDTPCAAVFWAQSTDLQIKNLRIANTLLDSVDSGSHQAVALRTDGDKTHLEGLRLIGRQDTLWVNAGEAPSAANKIGAYPLTRIARAYVADSYIEGDTDFVFGRANAVFERCHFQVVSSRKADQAIVFAPDTVPGYSYGFLVIHSTLTGDAGYQGSGKALLGRSWDQGASATGYLPGNTPNGQLVIRDSHIDSSFNPTAPWGAAATTNRAYRGNADPTRQLDDVAFNRLWEYRNRPR